MHHAHHRLMRVGAVLSEKGWASDFSSKSDFQK